MNASIDLVLLGVLRRAWGQPPNPALAALPDGLRKALRWAWMMPPAPNPALAYLPGRLREAARADKAIRGRFRALSPDQQDEVLGCALDRLLEPIKPKEPEDPVDRASTRWLDDDHYTDNPEGGVFGRCGYRLMVQAIDTALHALQRESARYESLEEWRERILAEGTQEEGTQEVTLEEALDSTDRMTPDEGAAILDATRLFMDSEQQRVLAAIAAAPAERKRKTVLSNSAIERQTGIPRRRVAVILEELRGNERLRDGLHERMADPPPLPDSLRARTAPAGSSDDAWK